MIVMVGGSRGYSNYKKVIDWANAIDIGHVLIHGDCPNSPDVWAGGQACLRGLVVGKFPFVSGHGLMGGHKRNRAMVDMADKCVFFWDGQSGGTGKTIEYAKSKGKEVEVHL